MLPETPEQTTDAAAIVEVIRPLLAGREPQVQGAVLAELLATWLAGHVVEGNPAETDRLREKLLRAHLATVRKLVAVNAKRIHEGRQT